MGRIFVIYVGGKPTLYSFVANITRAKARELARDGHAARILSKPEAWIQNHQQVILIQSFAENAADQSKLDFQKLQATRAKVFGLFGLNMPVQIGVHRQDRQVIFGTGQRTVVVTFKACRETTLHGTLNSRLIDIVTRRFKISNIEPQDAIKELAGWINDEWNELDLTETPW